MIQVNECFLIKWVANHHVVNTFPSIFRWNVPHDGPIDQAFFCRSKKTMSKVYVLEPVLDWDYTISVFFLDSFLLGNLCEFPKNEGKTYSLVPFESHFTYLEKSQVEVESVRS